MTEKSDDGLRVIELRVDSFMGIELAQIAEVDGEGLVLVGGNNGAGKTSLLSAIECAIRGKRWHPAAPVKRGAKKAIVDLDLGDLRIRRTFNPDGTGTLRVENAEGMAPRRPQEILDALAGQISFDPLAFSRMEPAAQLDLAREIGGVDTKLLDAEIETSFQIRANANRTEKEVSARLAAMPQHADAPGQPVVVAELLSRLEEIQSTNTRNDAERANLHEIRAQHGENLAEVARVKATIEQYQLVLAEAEQACALSLTAVNEKGADVGALEDGDPAPVRSEIATAEDANTRHRENAEHDRQTDLVAEARRNAEECDADLETLRRKRRDMIRAATLPIEGLEITDDGLTYHGTPFAQASGAERLRTSVAMGAAMSPRLRVMLIREAEKLDDQGLELLAAMAAEGGLQLWLERVGDRDAGAIVISEGRVAE